MGREVNNVETLPWKKNNHPNPTYKVPITLYAVR